MGEHYLLVHVQLIVIGTNHRRFVQLWQEMSLSYYFIYSFLFCTGASTREESAHSTEWLWPPLQTDKGTIL